MCGFWSALNLPSMNTLPPGDGPCYCSTWRALPVAREHLRAPHRRLHARLPGASVLFRLDTHRPAIWRQQLSGMLACSSRRPGRESERARTFLNRQFVGSAVDQSHLLLDPGSFLDPREPPEIRAQSHVIQPDGRTNDTPCNGHLFPS